MADISKVDNILQFILLAAGRSDDYRDRELGPIHLIKYLYLADLSYAEAHDGETFTKIPWRFHHFGPWSTEAFNRIDPALEQIGATKKRISSYYADDFTRWSVDDEKRYHQLSEELPIHVVSAVKGYIQEFSSSTEDLLHFVYNTVPMLQAAPEAFLDFNVVSPHQEKARPIGNDDTQPPKELSKTQQKKRKQKLDQLKKQFREKLKKKQRKRVEYAQPRYDDVFFEGLKTLDYIAGSDVELTKGVARFSDDIWKSESRFDPDVS